MLCCDLYIHTNGSVVHIKTDSQSAGPSRCLGPATKFFPFFFNYSAWYPLSAQVDTNFADKRLSLADSAYGNQFGSDSYGVVDALTEREDASVAFNCCWASPAQCFSSLSPAGLTAIFYCLNFWVSPNLEGQVMYLFPPGTGEPNYTSRHWVINPCNN
jgi:hypothetical protein